MNTKTLAVIFTPLQYLNVLRYCETYPDEVEILVLTTNQVNINQLKNIDVNKKCKYPSFGIRSNNDDLNWLLKVLYVKFLKIENYEKVVIGNLNNILAYSLGVRFNYSKKEVVLLDDGLASIDNYCDRNLHRKLFNERLFGGRLLGFYKTFLNINKVPIPKLSFFTNFELSKLCEESIDEVIVAPVKHTEDMKIVDEVWFVGAPLVELNILPRDMFLKIISNVKQAVARECCDFIYVNHRFERLSKPGVSVKTFSQPLELVFAQQIQLPRRIISFYSTALVNLAGSYPGLECKYIDIRDFLEHSGRLDDIYRLFEFHRNLEKYKF